MQLPVPACSIHKLHARLEIIPILYGQTRTTYDTEFEPNKREEIMVHHRTLRYAITLRSTSVHGKSHGVDCTSYWPSLSISSRTSLMSPYFEIQHLPMRASTPVACFTSIGYCPAQYLSWIKSSCSPNSGKIACPCQRWHKSVPRAKISVLFENSSIPANEWRESAFSCDMVYISILPSCRYSWSCGSPTFATISEVMKTLRT